MSSVRLSRRTAVIVATAVALVLFYTLFNASNEHLQTPFKSLCESSGFYKHNSLEELEGDIPDLQVSEGGHSVSEDPRLLAEVFPEPLPLAVNKTKLLKGDPTPHFRGQSTLVRFYVR